MNLLNTIWKPGRIRQHLVPRPATRPALFGILVMRGIIVLLFFFLSPMLRGQSLEDSVHLLIRCDDIGMCHAVNAAVKEFLDTGIPFSASVMFACPWYQEAVEILKHYSHVSVGVHLTLNSEWKNYRWGPVLGSGAVPSLVDSAGYFFPSRALFHANNPRLGEVESELRAQIERAKRAGMKVTYVDYHMGAAVDTPELRAIVEKLASEYSLGISRYFGEVDVEGIYRAPASQKLDTLLSLVNSLKPGPLQLMVFHLGLETPEMDALVDQNSFGLLEMSKHRHGELQALLSHKFHQALREKHVHCVTYSDLVEKIGIANMKAPK